MAGQYGVKESSEAVVGAFALAKEVKKVAKDGLQVADFAALYAAYQADPVLRAKLDAAIKDIQKVGNEVGELDLQDGFALLQVTVPALMDFLG